jgi:hypothetical protein
LAKLRTGRDAIALRAATPERLQLDQSGFTLWDEYSDTPASQIQLIEGRSWSSLFDIDDTAWGAVVEPVLDGLRALAEPHRPRRRCDRYPLLVWTAMS